MPPSAFSPTASMQARLPALRPLPLVCLALHFAQGLCCHLTKTIISQPGPDALFSTWPILRPLFEKQLHATPTRTSASERTQGRAYHAILFSKKIILPSISRSNMDSSIPTRGEKPFAYVPSLPGKKADCITYTSLLQTISANLLRVHS